MFQVIYDVRVRRRKMVLNVRKWVAWGKLERRDGKTVAIHSLVDHSTDVAFVLVELLLLPAVQRACRATARLLEEDDRQRLAVLTFLHDVGKANAGFQTRYWAHEIDRPPYWRIPACGHGPQGWALFTGASRSTRRVADGLPLDELDSWGEAVVSLLHASLSHHGRPIEADATDCIWEPIMDDGQVIYDSAVVVAEIGERAKALFPQAFIPSEKELPTSSEFAHLFAGLVQLADWLASDTRFFPYSEPGEDRAATAPRRACNAVRAIGLAWEGEQARSRTASMDFATIFGVPVPRPMQAAMADPALGQIVVLEAETGSGKTEAALWRFLHLWHAGEVDALYFALPTRVAATQVYERVRAFAERAWRSNKPLVVRALPGYAAADGHVPDRLPDFHVLWPDDPTDCEADRRWAAEAPKRYLAAPIAVGTIDQALLSVLQVRHAHLRHATLVRSLLVVDEVHASDAYMTRLTEHLLRTHVSCGGHALLLSATLGAVARTRYLAIGQGNGSVAHPTLDDAEHLPYPAIGTIRGNRPVLQAAAGNPRSKHVHLRTIDAIDEPERVAELALDAASRGARVLVVRNTVDAAIATLRAVEAAAGNYPRAGLFRVAGVETLHHGRFAPGDRPLMDAEVEGVIGKHRVTPGGIVLIGTQTLEQSLDIDADLLVTDLCPMDVFLQRLGRLHRHLRPRTDAPDDRRPAGFEDALAWVLVPPKGDLAPFLRCARHGLGPIRRRGKPVSGVYADLRVIEATRRLIEEAPVREIPADNRALVERSTHPEALAAIAREMGPNWEHFGQEYDGMIHAMGTVANIHAIDFEREFELFAVMSGDESAVSTRIGAANRQVAFPAPLPLGPFGQEVARLALPHHMLPTSLALSEEPRNIEPLGSEPGFRFTLGAGCYRYSRFGIERMRSEG